MGSSYVLFVYKNTVGGKLDKNQSLPCGIVIFRLGVPTGHSVGPKILKIVESYFRQDQSTGNRELFPKRYSRSMRLKKQKSQNDLKFLMTSPDFIGGIYLYSKFRCAALLDTNRFLLYKIGARQKNGEYLLFFVNMYIFRNCLRCGLFVQVTGLHAPDIDFQDQP